MHIIIRFYESQKVTRHKIIWKKLVEKNEEPEEKIIEINKKPKVKLWKKAIRSKKQRWKRWKIILSLIIFLSFNIITFTLIFRHFL